MLSHKKQLEIGNIVLTYVATEFAMFSNPKNRGENFTWDYWINNCEVKSDSWMHVHNVKGDQGKIKEFANKYARQTAQILVNRMLG